MDDKPNSLEEAEKEADQRRKKGEHFAVCFSDTDLIKAIDALEGKTGTVVTFA